MGCLAAGRRLDVVVPESIIPSETAASTPTPASRRRQPSNGASEQKAMPAPTPASALSVPALTTQAGADAVDLHWTGVSGALRYELMALVAFDIFTRPATGAYSLISNQMQCQKMFAAACIPGFHRLYEQISQSLTPLCQIRSNYLDFLSLPSTSLSDVSITTQLPLTHTLVPSWELHQFERGPACLLPVAAGSQANWQYPIKPFDAQAGRRQFAIAVVGLKELYYTF